MVTVLNNIRAIIVTICVPITYTPQQVAIFLVFICKNDPKRHISAIVRCLIKTVHNGLLPFKKEDGTLPLPWEALINVELELLYHEGGIGEES